MENSIVKGTVVGLDLVLVLWRLIYLTSHKTRRKKVKRS